MSDAPPASAPKPVLSLLDGVAITVGIVIGAGIFRLPSFVAGILGNELWILAVWFLGGAVSFIGALCFAELTTAYPSAGGEYHFLSRAFGRSCGFMFAWARMTVVQTGSIALLSFTFGDYAAQLLPLGPYGPSLYAAVVVVALTAVNIMGLHEARSVQKLLFGLTILGLLSVIAAGAMTAPGPAAAAAGGPSGDVGVAAVGSAMIFVLLTYGGWNEAAYVSAEMRGGPGSMVRMLLLSIGIITLLYVAVNFVYVHALGTAAVAASSAVASDVMLAAVGSWGAMIISLVILVVVLSSVNVTILTGARTNFAFGCDFHVFRFLSHWSARNAPVRALLFQGAIALMLVALGAINRGGVQTAVDYLSPVFWLFFLLTGGSLFVLRAREPDAPRPFRVPLYPVVPALFCLASAAMLYSSLSFTGNGALAGVGVLALGLPFLFLARGGPRTQPS